MSLSERAASMGDGTLLLLPAFTRCHGSCPITVRALKKATELYASNGNKYSPGDREKPPYRIILLSFDSGDSAADLSDFRKREGIPSSWKIVRSPDGQSVRGFLDQFRYFFMQSEAGFDHPRQLLVFSRDLRWAGNLSGSDLTAQDLKGAIERTSTSRLRSIASHPTSWLFFGAMGLTAGLTLLLAAIRRLRTSASANSMKHEA